jgi:Na+-transporting methylmalonyl-CoA/oxaloacetate decarboxylase beta subunit
MRETSEAADHSYGLYNLQTGCLLAGAERILRPVTTESEGLARHSVCRAVHHISGGAEWAQHENLFLKETEAYSVADGLTLRALSWLSLLPEIQPPLCRLLR